MTKEDLIIQKLLKIAENQQKILQKLAQQANPAQQDVTLLDHTVNTAGTILSMPLTATTIPKSGGGYTVTVEGFPPVRENNPKDIERDNKLKTNFKAVFDTQLKNQQRGDLLNSLALVYKNKAAGVA